VKLITLACLFSGLLAAQPAQDPVATARKGVDLLVGEKYPELFQMFSPTLQQAIPQDQLAKLGDTVKKWGMIESVGQPEVRKAGTNTVVILPVKFSSQDIRFTLRVNAAGQLDILNMMPGEAPWQHPAYAKLDSFTERNVTIGEGEWKLPGTLTIPKGGGPFPGVVLVHGSGPNDRDGTLGGMKILKDLAEGLASRGVMVLRYEKRTHQYPAKTKSMGNMTVKEEVVDDALAAAALLREQKEADPKRVFVLGHSLGGYVAPRIAAVDGKLAGLIIMGANVRPLEDLYLEQSIYLEVPPKQLEGIKVQVARIKALDQGDADAPPLLGMPVPYLLDLKGYDPSATAKDLAIRMLILQGERDFQVTMKDFNLWKSALGSRKDVTFHTYPALNHFFVAGQGKSTEAEYTKPGHVAPEVIDDIAKWILG
jgi:fermentation-respiration switch protein FrsA (DUF1100 family)